MFSGAGSRWHRTWTWNFSPIRRLGFCCVSNLGAYCTGWKHSFFFSPPPRFAADSRSHQPHANFLCTLCAVQSAVALCRTLRPRCGFALELHCKPAMRSTRSQVGYDLPTLQLRQGRIDANQFFYECSNCKAVLKPKPGDCCVFCSYGSVKCPPKQAEQVAA